MTYLRKSRSTLGFGYAVKIAALGIALTGCGGASNMRNMGGVDKEAERLQDHRWLVALARDAMRRGDTIRAEHYFSLALENGHDEAELLPELLAVCLSSSRVRSALNYAEPYLRKHPEDLGLRYLVATLHLGLGHQVPARVELETVLRHEPDYPDALFLLGIIALESEPELARRYLAHYLELQPTGDKAREARERLEVERLGRNDRRGTSSSSAQREREAPVPQEVSAEHFKAENDIENVLSETAAEVWP